MKHWVEVVVRSAIMSAVFGISAGSLVFSVTDILGLGLFTAGTAAGIACHTTSYLSLPDKKVEC